MNAALAVVEPASTGLGGDCFALIYSAADRKVYGLNGSGRTSSECTLKRYKEKLQETTECDDPSTIKSSHGLNVTVPGNVCGTMDILDRFGTMSRERVLSPAIDLAEKGFTVGPVTSYWWNQSVPKLVAMNEYDPNGYGLLLQSKEDTFRGPKTGEIMTNRFVGECLQRITVHGKSAFYNGVIADRIVDAVQRGGGLLTKSDLRRHRSEWVEPIGIDYKETVRIWEIPPNGQGIAALMALNFYQQKQQEIDSVTTNLNLDHFDHFVADLHHKSECMRSSFRFSREFISDLSHHHGRDVDFHRYLSSEFARTVASEHIRIDGVNMESLLNGHPLTSSDTVSFCAVDRNGNGCSFISSIFEHFGSGIVPKHCGFALQNRGYNLKKTEHGHPNGIGPGKRPYHTIIPGLATTMNGDLYCTFSVMGGFMQPQGHFQVISNLIDRGMNPQEALDAPRFCIYSEFEGGTPPHGKETVLLVEDQYRGQEVVDLLTLKHGQNRVDLVKGHERGVFGRGQIIYRDPHNGVLRGGSDPRAPFQGVAKH